MEKEDLEQVRLKKLAREKLLGDGYGKYDYVEKLLDSDYILSNKPRIIRSRISELLEIPEEKLNYKTFISWIINYRKKDAKRKKDPSSLNNQKLSEKNTNDPSDFTPTDPGILDKKREEDYLKNLIKMPYKT